MEKHCITGPLTCVWAHTYKDKAYMYKAYQTLLCLRNWVYLKHCDLITYSQ